MPCRDDRPGPMEPKFLELERHIKWLEEKLNIKIADTCNLSLTQENLDYLTDSLCSTIRIMNEDEQNQSIYNGRDPYARKVADWWDCHQEMDRRRIAHEKGEKEQQRLIDSAKKKLTAAEFDAIINARL